MRIALVSDAWTPQVNGVVRTLAATVTQLRTRGHDVLTVTPNLFRTVPCPSYPEIRLAIGCGRAVTGHLEGFAPDALHIATEGPLGWAARGWAMRGGSAFTTSFHTRFADYLAVRTRLPEGLFWPAVTRFHRPAAKVYAATATLERELTARGLTRLHRWSRGVDLSQFSPGAERDERMARLPRPIQLYVGRVAPEKNIAAFLSTDVPGSKVVVGEGPARAALARAFPNVSFVGPCIGQALASAYATADVLVFPSRTDTFGLVMIEALASGTPVAAYPVPGPLDILGPEGRGRLGHAVGALDDDLTRAIRRALQARETACVNEAKTYDWSICTDQFLSGLVDTGRAGIMAVARPQTGRLPIREFA